MFRFLKEQRGSVLILFAIAIGILLIIILGFKAKSLFSESENSGVDPDTYQAVFLTNSQIYFGQLKNLNSSFVLLSDVYYVQVRESPLEGETVTKGVIVKLGENEPHGPTDDMFINKDQILFWENLRSDSQIIRNIQNLKLQRK